MQRVNISCLRPEMVSAVEVEDPGGRALITAGSPFQESHIKALKTIGFGSVYVDLPSFIGAQRPEGLISTVVQTDAVKIIRKVYDDFKIKKEMDDSPVRELASRLVNEVIPNRDQLFQGVDLRATDSYLAGHVVNVAVLSIMIGLKSGYSITKLHELAIGALLMDIGEMLIPPEILRKTDQLTPAEMEEVKKHSLLGFDGLRKKLRALPVTSMHVAYQHHESFDGKGYPRGISGTDIHEYARIVCVADMFDALVSDRPFRHYYLNHEALSILHALSGRFLDPDIVPLLSSQVALYPQGTLVQVDTGETGEIETVNLQNPSRPRIRILKDSWGNRIKEKDAWEMALKPSRYIIKVLKDQEIVDWVIA